MTSCICGAQSLLMRAGSPSRQNQNHTDETSCSSTSHGDSQHSRRQDGGLRRAQDQRKAGSMPRPRSRERRKNGSLSSGDHGKDGPCSENCSRLPTAMLGDFSSQSSCPSREDVEAGNTIEAPVFNGFLIRIAPYFSEFVGCLVIAMVWNCRASTLGTVWKPTRDGLTLMVLTYAFAGVSGAHFNPAVSLSAALAGKATWRDVFAKIPCQFLGCILGVGITYALFGGGAPNSLALRGGYRYGGVFMLEGTYTFLMCFVYLNCLCSRQLNSVKHGNQFYGIAMGFALIAGGYAAQDVSGAVFNPALAAAVCAENSIREFWPFAFYCLSHIIAAFIGALMFRLVRPNEDKPYAQWMELVREERESGISRLKVFGEAIGTWMFVFTIGMTHAGRFPMSRPFAAAAVYVSMHYTVFDSSGGYFNPAVTLSVLMSGRWQYSYLACFLQGVGYISTQIFSGTMAAMMYQNIGTGQAWTSPYLVDDKIKEYGVWRVCATESIFLGFLCYAVIATATLKGIGTPLPENQYNGLAFGFAYAGGGVATFGLTGGVLNPAIVVGHETARYAIRHDLTHFWSKSGVMLVFAVGGALIAVVLFRLTHVRLLRKEKAAELDLEQQRLLAPTSGEKKPLMARRGSVSGSGAKKLQINECAQWISWLSQAVW